MWRVSRHLILRTVAQTAHAIFDIAQEVPGGHRCFYEVVGEMRKKRMSGRHAIMTLLQQLVRKVEFRGRIDSENGQIMKDTSTVVQRENIDRFGEDAATPIVARETRQTVPTKGERRFIHLRIYEHETD